MDICNQQTDSSLHMWPAVLPIDMQVEEYDVCDAECPYWDQVLWSKIDLKLFYLTESARSVAYKLNIP